MYTKIQLTINNAARRLLAVTLLLMALSTMVAAQTERLPRQAGPQGATPTQTKPTAQYDIGAIVKKLSALEAQVTELKKRNEALEATVKKMDVQIGSLKLQQTNVSGLTAELQKLNNALRNHTHSINVGVMALSAIPGMQDLANKAGVGYVIQQWQTMKMLWTPGGGPGETGTAIIP